MQIQLNRQIQRTKQKYFVKYGTTAAQKTKQKIKTNANTKANANTKTNTTSTTNTSIGDEAEICV